MILINLLPHREEKRRLRKRTFFMGLALAGVCGLAVAGLWYSVLSNLISAQDDRNRYLRSANEQLDLQIKDIAQLNAEIEGLKARQRAVEDLQTNRNVPVYLLDELVKHTPEGVYLKAIKQLDQVVTVEGVAQTNERVSEFLRNTLNNAQWLERPELVEIKVAAAQAQAAGKDQRRLYDFSMRLSLKRPGAPAAASAPASGAASTPAAPTKAV